MSSATAGTPGSREEAVSLDTPYGRRKLRNNYHWSDEYGALVLPHATPDDSGGSLAFKPHEPISMKFIEMGGAEAGTAAELDRSGRSWRRPGTDPFYGRLLDFYSAPIPDASFEHTVRPVPTEMEAMAKLAKRSERTGMSASNAANGRERMVILWDGGSPALSISASCVFLSDNQDWVAVGSRSSVDLSKLGLGRKGRYAMAVADPATGESRTMKVINLGLSMPNPMGGGAYAVFGIEKEEPTDDGEDGADSAGEEIRDNASFL